MSMQVLDDASIEQKLAWPKVLEALEQAFQNRSHFKVPDRTAISSGASVYLTMPCADKDGWFGVKQVSVIPSNPRQSLPSVQAWYTLMNPNGQAVISCSATLLTRLRTSAVSAIAAKHLISPLSRHLLIIGTGSLAPWMAEAHAQVHDYAAISVWGRDINKAKVTATNISERLSRNISVSVELEAAVRQADVISMATTSSTAILKGAWLRPGQHIDIVGAFTADMAEVDADVVKVADVFVDDLDACQTEAGDLIQAQAQGWSWDMVYGELSELVTGGQGRQTPQRITLFKSVGLALEDLAVAKLLVD